MLIIQVMKQVVAINKKLNNIKKENTDIKDEVEEISQFLTDNDFAITNAQNNVIPPYNDYPRYQDPNDLWNGWEYSPNGSFGYSTPRRITPRCDVGLPQGSPLTRHSTPMSGQRFTSFIQTPAVSISQRPSLSLSKSNSALFDARLLADIKEISQSRYNFAVNLVRHCFDEETRKKSNISGKRNKQRLDSKKISQATFQMYPCVAGESKLGEWKKCHKAIDETPADYVY